MLYVINAVGTTLYKIGYSQASPERRVNELQTGCPYPLKVILAAEGEREDEAAIHNWMDAQGWRVRSEWFDIKDHNLWHLFFQSGLNKRLKMQPLQVFSVQAEDKQFEEGVFEEYLTKYYHYERTSSFNGLLGTIFDDFYHHYSQHCKRYSTATLPASKVLQKFYEMKIGSKINDAGQVIFNLRMK